MLRGYAGSKKTTALQPVHNGLIASGRNPLYLLIRRWIRFVESTSILDSRMLKERFYFYFYDFQNNLY